MILAASPNAKTLSGLSRFLKKSQWLGVSNRYSEKTTRRIKTEQENGGLLNPRNLSQYIAASSVLHGADGWSYVGKSLWSLLRGDIGRAVHLAYYAELRAAMSLFASEGIGVFDRYHYYIDAPCSVKLIRRGNPTHQFVWDCLEYWATIQSSSDLLASIVKPLGQNLAEWHHPLNTGAKGLAPQSQAWFRDWGIDLEVFAKDRNSRNDASYRPDGIPSIAKVSGEDSLNFVRNVWAALEPSSTSNFENIDRHLLRLSLENRFKGLTNKTAAADPHAFRRFLQPIIQYQNQSELFEQKWLDFMERKSSAEDLQILQLSQVLPNAIESSPLAVISRAILLSRVAAGSIESLINEAGFDPSKLSFWWSEIGTSKGLWHRDNVPESALDLWSDIEMTIADVDNYQSGRGCDEQTIYDIGVELGHSLAALSSCERVAVWNIAAE